VTVEVTETKSPTSFTSPGSLFQRGLPSGMPILINIFHQMLLLNYYYHCAECWWQNTSIVSRKSFRSYSFLVTRIALFRTYKHTTAVNIIMPMLQLIGTYIVSLYEATSAVYFLIISTLC